MEKVCQLENKLAEMIPSIIHHTTDDINLVKQTIPVNLIPAPDTIKLHEVQATSCGILSFKFISSVSESKLFTVQKISKHTGLSMKSNSILFNSYKYY